MVTLLWPLVWLSLAQTAAAQLPHPAHLTVTSAHVLTWAPGPGMPPDVHYNVTFITSKGSVWTPVPGCERVRNPLVCKLTKTFTDWDKEYFIKVTALLEDQVLGSEEKHFLPIRDIHLDPPLLTLTPCDRDLCVDLQPPLEDLRRIYEVLHYSLKIWTNGLEHTKDVKFLRGEVLRNLSPGRKYCVSVRFSDHLVNRSSNYSGPVCGVAPGNPPAATDALIAGILCSATLVAVAMVVWLAAAGYICVIKGPLPRVLATVRHVEGALLFPGSSLTSVLPVEATAPPAGTQQTLPEEAGEEQLTEGSGGSSGGGYMLREGCKLLSSSCSSSSAVRPSASAGVGPSCQTPPQPPAGGPASAAPPRSCQAPAESGSGGDAQEEEEEEERGSSQDVNLLTLTFGMQPEDRVASSSSEDVTSEPTWTFCPVGGEGEGEEEEEESGYMCHWTRP